MTRQQRVGSGAISLHDSGAETETGTGSAILLPYCEAIAFTIDVTAAATEVGDLLDATIQTTINGVDWIDVVAFTQVLGNGGAKTYVAKLNASIAEDDFETAAALAAGSVRNLMGDTWRASWAITDAGDDNASFTFSVVAMPM